MMIHMSFLYKFLYIISSNQLLVGGANWAQVSGPLEQNIVIPTIASPSRPHWAPRYGAIAVNVSSTIRSDGSTTPGHVYFMGGDTYAGDNEQMPDPGYLDKTWYSGYKNDVWRMDGTDWYVHGHSRLRGPYKYNKIPEIRSELSWKLINPGKLPPPGTTYDDWIDKSSSDETMWSPRRHHSAVYMNDCLFVLGGRARELISFPESRAVGGIIGRIINDPFNSSSHMNQQRFTTQREASVPKNDVWKSCDGGVTWKRVIKGCKQPQKSVVSRANPEINEHGLRTSQCMTNSDCYGEEQCSNQDSGADSTVHGYCYCIIWSPREQHTVAVYTDWSTGKQTMYLSGGFGSHLISDVSACGDFACGDTDASGYRYYFRDLWSSSDGETWTQVAETAYSPGRGGHQMLIFRSPSDQTQTLWILGGQTRDDSGQTYELNDILSTSLPGATVWKNETMAAPWGPRFGHTAIYEPGVPSNNYMSRLYVIGGETKGSIYDDVWTWRVGLDPVDTWSLDYSDDSFFSSGDGSQFRDAQGSPTRHYVYPDGNVSLLQRFFVPAKLNVSLQRLQLRPLITEEKLNMLYRAGVYTIRDLADADLYTILKLRGFDVPQVPASQRLAYHDVCDVRKLAIEVVKKCSVDLSRSIYESDWRMPWNIAPVFDGPLPTNQTISWHGISNYDFLLSPADDPVSLLENWNGCDYIPSIEGVFGTNVDRLGFVSQVQSSYNPSEDLSELICRQNPGARSQHSGAIFEERVYLFGGKSSSWKLFGDTWYRDAYMPTARFGLVPKTHTSQHWFEFISDKPGVQFEYRVWDPVKYRNVRPWLPATKKTSVSWLNWRLGGPSNGVYTMYVRAIDPAGNKDVYYSTANAYNWYYISPTPVDIIFEVIMSIIGVLILGLIEYRRRRRKAAMERYAMKRMRRKFKALQRDAGSGTEKHAFDWRRLFKERVEADDDPAKKFKAKQLKRKLKEKRKEQRKKEQKKKEREKEKIRKKLRETKMLQESAARVAVDESKTIEDGMDDPLSKKSKKKPKAGEKSSSYESSEEGGDSHRSARQRWMDMDEDEQLAAIEEQNFRRFKTFEASSTTLPEKVRVFSPAAKTAKGKSRGFSEEDAVGGGSLKLSIDAAKALEGDGTTKQRRVFKRPKDEDDDNDEIDKKDL